MPSAGNICWFSDIRLNDRPSVGGKGASLGELAAAGIAVPAGFVVCTTAFEQFLAVLEKQEPIRSRVNALSGHDLTGVRVLSDELRARIQNASLPDDLRTEITRAHADLCGENANWPMAVRSSATTEDAEDASFAGLQDTYLWVMGAEPTLKNLLS